jgi:hypothetical protein
MLWRMNKRIKFIVFDFCVWNVFLRRIIKLFIFTSKELSKSACLNAKIDACWYLTMLVIKKQINIKISMLNTTNISHRLMITSFLFVCIIHFWFFRRNINIFQRCFKRSDTTINDNSVRRFFHLQLLFQRSKIDKSIARFFDVLILIQFLLNFAFF